MASLEERIGELRLDLRREVEDFVEFLLQKRARKPTGKMRLDWAGALADLKEQYTSVELQHQILRWRSGEE